jgi:DNA-binding MarR family transcriptional regulator
MNMKAVMELQKDQIVCDDIMTLIATCKQYLSEIAKDNSLTSMQLFALRAISDGNNATGKIAQILHCDASNVTGIVDRLTSLNLVTRKEDPQDRRVKTLHLTDEGEKLISSATESLPDKLGCERLTQQETEVLHNIVAKLTPANS